MAKKSPLRLNFAVLLLAQLYTQGLTALAGVLAVRILGPLEYGSYTLAVVGLNLGSIVADAGLAGYLGREAGRTPSEESQQRWRLALRVRLTLATLVGLVTLGLVALIPSLGQPSLALLAGLALIPTSAATLTTALLNGQGRIRLSATLTVINTTLNFGLTGLVLWWQGNAFFLLVETLAVSLISAVLFIKAATQYPEKAAVRANALSAGSNSDLRPSPDKPGEIFSLLKAGSGFWFIGLAGVIFQYADVYLVSALLGKEAVGPYGAALRLLTLATVIPTVWGVVALPRFAREPDKHKGELRRWGGGLTLAGLALGLAGLYFTGPLVTLLLGQKYAASVPVLQILWWAAAAIFASAAPVTWLTVTNRQYYILLALLLADSFGLLLVLLLAGLFQMGLEGVALARVGASWLLAGFYLFFGRGRTN